MSRFVALLEKYRSTPMTPKLFRQMAADMLPLLHAERGDITAAFPYFINKSAPSRACKACWTTKCSGSRAPRATALNSN